jgi:hypothetical protein
VFTVHAAGRRVMSSSMDRHVASWSVSSLKRQWRVGGLGGFVYQLAQSPQHPSLVCDPRAPHDDPGAVLVGGRAAEGVTAFWKDTRRDQNNDEVAAAFT